MKLRYNQAEADLCEFLSRFSIVDTFSKKERWQWERRFRLTHLQTENPRRGRRPIGELHVEFGDYRTRALDFGDAEAEYRTLDNADEHRYIVLPEVPATIGFDCRGQLPTMEDWQSIANDSGLPFGIVVVDFELCWLFGMTADWPGLGAYFAWGADS
ncbi:hypothetical protein [Pendulispora albinea]|uniref:Uncharacterized protein n=1 Tax=Pendulispora albinea TaxID=2741071 RepID=A0ABZ2MB80_9BACT